MLKSFYTTDKIEAGCDEAGRGCLAGPVVASAVILPKNFKNKLLTDSKKLSERQRFLLRPIILKQAIAWGLGIVSNEEIDEINILNASFLAMHRAITELSVKPNLLLIDGNRFNPYENLEYHCIIKGDSKYLSIAAASILAKTYRDEIMTAIDKDFPIYQWYKNKGYPTKKHREAIIKHGYTEHHRQSFKLIPSQLKLNLNYQT